MMKTSLVASGERFSIKRIAMHKQPHRAVQPHKQQLQQRHPVRMVIILAHTTHTTTTIALLQRPFLWLSRLRTFSTATEAEIATTSPTPTPWSSTTSTTATDTTITMIMTTTITITMVTMIRTTTTTTTTTTTAITITITTREVLPHTIQDTVMIEISAACMWSL